MLSFDEDGSERWIEVKSTKGNRSTAADLSERERMTAEHAPARDFHRGWSMSKNLLPNRKTVRTIRRSSSPRCRFGSIQLADP